MEKLIHQYLDINYFPYREGNDPYRLYLNDNELEILSEVQPYSLMKDLKSIYLLEEEEIKLFVYTWAVNIFPDIDLDKYWEKLSKFKLYTMAGEGNYSHAEGNWSQHEGFTNIEFPTVRQVFSTVVASDLVSVQPMSLPKGNWFYFIPQIKKQTPKQKLNNILNKAKIFIRKMEKDIRKYLHITNYNTTFVTR